jgi:4-hydroxybenzoate polyprenyltransferase
MLMAHHLSSTGDWFRASIAFIAFSLAASGVYLVNDLIDRELDQGHPFNRTRPLASGQLSRRNALFLAALLIVLAAAISLAISWTLFIVVVSYVVAGYIYSTTVTRIPFLDIFTLGSFYLWRLIAGAEATDVSLSPWLVAFVTPLFLSLAIGKRYAEILGYIDADLAIPRRKPYAASDLPIMHIAGIGLGYIAVGVLSAYVQSSHAAAMYSTPTYIWILCVFGVIWIHYFWRNVKQSNISGDPVIFCMKDGFSRAIVLIAIAIFMIST